MKLPQTFFLVIEDSHFVGSLQGQLRLVQKKKTSTFRRTAVRETGASRHHGYLIEDPSEAIKYQFSMVPRGSRDPQLGRHYAEKHKSLEPKWYIFLAWNYILKILIMFVEIFLSSLTRNVILIKLIRSLKINKLHALK